MKKLLIISGPTATGKTSLAMKLAQQFNGQLISADSRQIYQGMDIGTGKDHPKNTPIHLIDIITPDQAFSAAQYRQMALPVIDKATRLKKLPILVGGTGQYVDAIINPQPSFTVKPFKLLRTLLNPLPITFLQKILRIVDFNTYKKLNNSDINNPHRLIRKIEIKICQKKRQVIINNKFDLLHISLTAPNNFLYQQIDNRVQSRLNSGLIDEIKTLLKKYKWSDPGLNTLAYKEFKNYIKKPDNQSLISSIERWKFDEHAYARRQKTWFKNKSSANIVDITQKDYDKVIIDLITNWLPKNETYQN